MTPHHIVMRAAEFGIDAIAITDHNASANVVAALQAGERYGVKVFPGNSRGLPNQKTSTGRISLTPQGQGNSRSFGKVLQSDTECDRYRPHQSLGSIAARVQGPKCHTHRKPFRNIVECNRENQQ